MKEFNEKMKEYDLLESLSNMNEKGYFDTYSDEHFLIKAMQGKLDYFKKYKHLIKGSLYFSDDYNNAVKFVANFSTKFKFFCNHFNEDEMKKFVINQLSAGKKNYDEAQFFRAFSEIHVLNFLMAHGPKLKKAIYEPKLGTNGSNPEARLEYENGIIIDVEVKTPGFKSQITGSKKGFIIPTFILDEKLKKNLRRQCDKRGFEFILPRVDKLKDFINSAGKKFEIPKDNKHINLLFINWTYTDVERRGYLEPYSLLYNNLNGLLKNKEIALSIGINEEALKKISAVIIYQDCFDSLVFGEFLSIWKGYNFRMLPNHLIDENLIDINLISKALHMNPPKKNDNMMPYQVVVKREYLDDGIEITDYINKRIKGKVNRKEDNFTYFTNRYYKKKNKENKKILREYNKLKE